VGDLSDFRKIENTFLIDPCEINAMISQDVDLIAVHADINLYLIFD